MNVLKTFSFAAVTLCASLFMTSCQSNTQQTVAKDSTATSTSTETTIAPQAGETISMRGEMDVHTNGLMPKVGTAAPDFEMTKNDMTDVKLSDFLGKRVILNIFPSVDTGVCAASVRHFNQEAANLNNTVVLCLSKDLPFAQKRFCGAEGIDNAITVSAFRSSSFDQNYGMVLTDSPMKGLLARGVIVIDEKGNIVYTELVPDISHEPNYDAALALLK